eukprot:14176930-Ditylum_brightwellii.AAC.1
MAFLTFFKAMFGSGLLALPNAFHQVGLPLGIITYMCVSIGCTFSAGFILYASQVISENRRLQPCWDEEEDDDAKGQEEEEEAK